MGVVALVSSWELLSSFCGNMTVLEVSSFCSGGDEDGSLYMMGESLVSYKLLIPTRFGKYHGVILFRGIRGILVGGWARYCPFWTR